MANVGYTQYRQKAFTEDQEIRSINACKLHGIVSNADVYTGWWGYPLQKCVGPDIAMSTHRSEEVNSN